MKIKQHNSKLSYIPDHPYRILIIGGSGLGKTNALLNLIDNRYILIKYICMQKIHMKKNANFYQFFVSSSIEVVTEIEDEVFCTRKCNLAAVINHSRNLNSGHYTCLVKDGETWWHCNDKAVLRVNLDDINKSLPYILFYQAK